MKYLCCLSLFFVVGLAGCGDDDAGCIEGMSITCACTDGNSGAQVCQADGSYAACVCGGAPSGRDADTTTRLDSGQVRFDAGPGFDGGPGGDASCEDFGGASGGNQCTQLYGNCTNTFTYAVDCDGTTCRCLENDLEQTSFAQSNYCGNISPEFRANLTTTNCGWDWTAR